MMLDALDISKYQLPLIIAPTFKPIYDYCSRPHYSIDILEVAMQMLPPPYNKTTVYGYGGLTYDPCWCSGKYVAMAPGPTFDVNSFEAIDVTWNNKLDKPHMFAVDPTLHWANPNGLPMPPHKPWPPFPPGFPKAQFPIPTVTHLHGGETPSEFDGFPDSWFTFNGLTGPTYTTNRYTYLNDQQSSNLFYHDHTLGMTRLNVYAGLSGAYIIHDPSNPLDMPDSPLPQGSYDIPLLIQDKTFNEDGSLYFPSNGINPTTHPYWRPSFFGNTQVVNGVVWPYFDVETRPYRFRLINGANSRIYTFKLSNGQPFIQVGSDSGYLEKPVIMDEITLAPAERADIIIDFSHAPIGKQILLLNVNTSGQTDPETTGQIMKFIVKHCVCCPPLQLPRRLSYIPELHEDTSKRTLVLNAATNNTGLLALLLDGQPWSNPISELPVVGSTQVWEFVNISQGPHPIHIHLIDFQVLNRQDLDVTSYANDWNSINGPSPLDHPTKVIDPSSYLIGNPIPPLENERGWKDTVLAYPGQVTRIIVPMFPSLCDPSCAYPGKNLFPFDPTKGPGYVWHCHLLDHEDNEMMRPMQIVNLPQ